MNTQVFKIVLVNLFKVVFYPIILARWNRDAYKYGIERCSKSDYFMCHARYFLKFRQFPELSGSTLNDVIFKMKIVDKNHLKVDCCDKLKVREYVSRRIGEQYLPRVYWHSHALTKKCWDELPVKFVLKTNHNSGCVFVIHDKDQVDFKNVQRLVSKSLCEVYGVVDGEWPYKYVYPQVFAEELLDDGSGMSPADYKFHCYKGRAKWVQRISGREVKATEIVLDRNGLPLNISLSPNMAHEFSYKSDQSWLAMLSLAEKLAEGFEYIRVDMYLVNGSVYFGELTFSPLAGLYQINTSRLFGQLLFEE